MKETVVDRAALEGVQDVDDMVEFACALVDTPSPTGDEGAVAAIVADKFRCLGLDVSRQEVEDGRSNVVARLTTGRPGPTLMLLAHFDTSTAPGEDLPFGYQARSVVDDGWIAGLGISNMKCAFAGFHSALAMLKACGASLTGEVIVAGVVGEIEKAPVDEWQGQRFRGGGIGARVLVNRGVTADFCINGEPTGLRLQLGNAGYMFVRVGLKGLPQATYAKERAVDPLPAAWAIYHAFGSWGHVYTERHSDHRMQALANIGAIHGGFPFKPSITAPYCNLYIHLNLMPGQNMIATRREVENFVMGILASFPGIKAEVSTYLASNGHEVSPIEPVAVAVATAHAHIFGTDVVNPPPARYSVSSDNSPLSEYGIPGITYGAGGINREGQFSMYQPNVGEVVSIDNLRRCAQVYAMAMADLLGEDSHAAMNASIRREED